MHIPNDGKLTMVLSNQERENERTFDRFLVGVNLPSGYSLSLCNKQVIGIVHHHRWWYKCRTHQSISCFSFSRCRNFFSFFSYLTFPVEEKKRRRFSWTNRSKDDDDEEEDGKCRTKMNEMTQSRQSLPSPKN